ncbi:MAG: hypothetical protein A2X32_08220 [Elusimicrobia bacterium GWC2_64_44]|nr:MAG: hypothetical protein A2X32_08220 [Elusimicrobia bacterium GWC2_64_44]
MPESNKNLIFTSTVNDDMARMAKNRKTFLTGDGKYDAAAWLKFATQFNAYMGHARRPFTPITGEHFKI